MFFFWKTGINGQIWVMRFFSHATSLTPTWQIAFFGRSEFTSHPNCGAVAWLACLGWKTFHWRPTYNGCRRWARHAQGIVRRPADHGVWGNPGHRLGCFLGTPQHDTSTLWLKAYHITRQRQWVPKITHGWWGTWAPKLVGSERIFVLGSFPF